jgi:hypothetical protein
VKQIAIFFFFETISDQQSANQSKGNGSKGRSIRQRLEAERSAQNWVRFVY